MIFYFGLMGEDHEAVIANRKDIENKKCLNLIEGNLVNNLMVYLVFALIRFISPKPLPSMITKMSYYVT